MPDSELMRMGTPANGFAAVAILEALIRKLVQRDVLSEDDISSVFHEVANVLGESAIANAKVAGSYIARMKRD